MASDTSSGKRGTAEEKAAKKALKKSNSVDVAALEKSVHLAELKAREIEAQVRYLEASAKYRDLKSEKREKKRRDKPEKSAAE